MADRVRPPFVLAFAGDYQGCGYHRMAVPLVTLCMAGFAEGRIDLAQWPIEMITAAAPDVVVFQRYVEDGQIELIRKIREACPNALLVYELDDYLGEIPPASFHAGFMPPGLDDRVRRAAALCDRVTTSTEPLAKWFREELGIADVRVVGNAVPEHAIRPREGRPTGQRLRVGFAGGISHAGDLEIVRPAMKALGEEVEWVFFGMQPSDAPVRVEFHPGVPPSDYQARMLGLDLDLVLAPLEDNRFNRCKSNLRLIEAGMIGACAIAQGLDPYTDGNPPVFAHANTPEEWTAAIRAFSEATQAERTESAAKLQDWVRLSHTLEKRAPVRREAWLGREGEKAWTPGVPRPRTDDVVLSLNGIADPPDWWRKMTPRKESLEEACASAAARGADVIWMRPGTALGRPGWDHMRAALAMGGNIAASVPLATDGPNAFPREQHWTPASPELVKSMSETVAISLRGRRLLLAMPSGPCVLLSAHALAMLGPPDVAGCDGHEEQAIAEWGMRATVRGLRTVQAADAFAACMMPAGQPTQKALQRVHLRGYSQAMQHGAGEALSKRERIEAEMDFLRMKWAGPQPGTMGFGFEYASWSALSGDLPGPSASGSNDALLTEVGFGDENAFAAAETGWIVFASDALEWKIHGFAALWKACSDAPDDVLVIYADNDISEGNTIYPDMKSDFDLELFLARDYVTPVCAIRTSVLNGSPPVDRNTLFAIVLRIAEEHGSHAIGHLPKFVATVKELASPEAKAVDAIARQMAIETQYRSMRIGGCDGVTVNAHPALQGVLSVKREWRAHRVLPPLVSIIVPTLGAGRLIQPCVNTIRQHTKYPNWELIVVQNGEREDPEIGEAAGNDPRVRVVRWEPADDRGFNWAALNNEVVREHAKGEFLCFMNDDVCTGSEEWLDAMMGHAVRRDVGAVGARLVHPAGFVQHVGVVVHKGIAGHLYKGMQNGQPGNGWLALITHEASAVTGACMLTSRDHFDAAGGFDAETFPLNYNDVDFCMKLRRGAGLGQPLRNVVEMRAEMLHPEGTTRTDPNDTAGYMRRLQADNARFAARWSAPDPYWPPNLAIGVAQGGMAINGLNREMLAWSDRPLPDRDAPRTLLVNDLPGLQGQALRRARVGEVCMAADLSGLGLRLTAPIPANIAAWDVRDPATLAADMRRLGITRVVVRSPVGSDGSPVPIEALRCVASLGIPVEADPIDPAQWTDEQAQIFMPVMEAAD